MEDRKGDMAVPLLAEIYGIKRIVRRRDRHKFPTFENVEAGSSDLLP